MIENPDIYIFLGATIGIFGLRYVFTAISNSYYGDMSKTYMPPGKRLIALWIGVLICTGPALIGFYDFGVSEIVAVTREFWQVSLPGKVFAIVFWLGLASFPVALIATPLILHFGGTKESHFLDYADDQFRN